MKNSILTLGAAVILVSSCGGENNGKVESTGETSFTGDLKIAYYVQDSIPNHFEYFVNMQAAIEKRAEEFQQKLAILQQEGQQLLDSYQRKMGAGLLSQNEQMSYEKRIQEKQYQIQVLQETDGQELERDSFNGNEELFEKMSEYGKKYAEKNGITILFNTQEAGQILYIDSTMDVTMDFINFMNEKEGGND